jgi:hypothetical protein
MAMIVRVQGLPQFKIPPPIKEIHLLWKFAYIVCDILYLDIHCQHVFIGDLTHMEGTRIASCHIPTLWPVLAHFIRFLQMGVHANPRPKIMVLYGLIMMMYIDPEPCSETVLFVLLRRFV